MLLLGVLQAQAAGQVAAGSFDLLETQVLTSSESSVVFSSIAATYGSTYQHLQIRATVRASGGGQEPLAMTINGVTATSSYRSHTLLGNGSTVTSIDQGNEAGMEYIGYIGNVTVVEAYAGVIIDILDPFETTKNTTARSLSGVANDSPRIALTSGVFLSTDAVNSIELTRYTGGTLEEFSRFSLYGYGKGV